MTKKSYLNKGLFGAGTALQAIALLGAGVAFSAPAMAQSETEAADDATSDNGAIVVTGSRITNPNLELSSPVGVITSAELELRQTNVAEQFLRELPSSVPSIGSAVNNGNGGASFVNLRGIGSVRNLVLLDGRRFTPADTSGRVDLNNIPLAVIERTDILTGGATTTYGADAISGVVNFVTKRNFEGIEANFSEQLTSEDDGNVFRADVTIGGNFGDGRGNAVFSIGYQEQDAVLQGGRGYSERQIGSFSGGFSGSSNAVPAVIIGPGGLFGQINEAGTDILPDVFDRPFNFNPFNLFQTPFERFNIYGSARYEVSDAVEVFTQAVFSKQTVSTIVAPGGSFFNTYQFNLNNPTIPIAIANRFCNGLGLTAAECSAGINTQFGPTLADGSINPDYQQFSAQVRRRSVEAGTRNNDYTTTVFHIVAGARGSITDSINWEVSGTYGESENFARGEGYGRFSTLQQGLLALPDGTCIDPSGGCVPVNLFGTEGSITADQIAYAFGSTQLTVRDSTFSQVQGLVDGDFGFGFTQTPIAFAAGVEYREFTAGQTADSASQTPGEILGAGGADVPFAGGYNVTDFYGELVVPLLEDLPFAESLTLELGGRYSDYSRSGTEFTWKAGGSWVPVSGLTIRGNYQRSSRAPNVGELFSPVSTGLSNLANDPCQGAAPLNDAALMAVCLAQGAPASTIGNILPPAAGQINVTSGGNPGLGTETARTWTVGFVAQPLSGLSFTFDYFKIKLTDAITSPTVGDIIGGCFDGSPDVNDVNCQLVRRSAFTGGLDGSPNEVPGLLLNLTNLGRIETDGIDVSAQYRTDLSDTVGLSLSFNGTWTNKNTFQAGPTGDNRDCVGFYSVNCGSIQPEFTFNQRTTFTFNDRFDLSLRWRYLSSVDQEPIDIVDNGPAFVGNSSALGRNVDFTHISAENYFDLSGKLDINDNVALTFTIQNVLDNTPPIVGTDVGSTAFNSGNTFPSTYDALGRRYGASVKFRF